MGWRLLLTSLIYFRITKLFLENLHFRNEENAINKHTIGSLSGEDFKKKEDPNNRVMVNATPNFEDPVSNKVSWVPLSFCQQSLII